MRHIALTFLVILAGCASRPAPLPQPQTPLPVSPQVRSDILGLTASELVQRFGTPALQIREGTGLKLQFRGRACVLDAYLYPPLHGGGPERVAHVDARLANGSDTDQLACIRSLQRV